MYEAQYTTRLRKSYHLMFFDSFFLANETLQFCIWIVFVCCLNFFLHWIEKRISVKWPPPELMTIRARFMAFSVTLARTCLARHLVDTPTSSAAVTIFSAEQLFWGRPDLAASRVVPSSSRRAAKHSSVHPVGLKRPGNLRLNARCTNTNDELWRKKKK